jgi:choline dehydrogenase
LEFDFIIVGAGSAGCVLANRLSENPQNRVLLLEAGGSDRRFFIRMPLGYGKTFYDPSINWMYTAEPDEGLAGQSDYWPRGKVLGGSSSINAMVYVRGHPQDYEDWKAAGNPGWGWPDVLEAFRKIENYEGGSAELHGLGGPLHVTNVEPQLHPLFRFFVQAAEAAGLSYNSDLNGRTQEGCGFYRITTRRGMRESAATAFLHPIRSRKNLLVETGAYVTSLIFDGVRATGVVYSKYDQSRTVQARQGVILAAGAVNSPQLLQLSGIGPAPLLQGLGIPVRVNNMNVGCHLQDHVGLNYTWRMRVPTLNNALRPWTGKFRAGLQYVVTRRGPLSLSINQGGGFFRTDANRSRPNMQLYMQPFSTLLPKAGERPLLTPDPFSGLSLGLSNCRPTTTGNIAISSPDPMEPPRIKANAYGTEHDILEMLDAVKFLRRIAAAEPLAGLIDEELRPGPACKTDEELIADIRLRSGTVYHPTCTCRMGPSADHAVVGSSLRVHGTRGLYVCDASVFPNIISGNTNATAIMMGYKGADAILSDNN